MLVKYIFVFVCFLIDGVLESSFNISFTMNSMYFVPCFGFSALVITVRKLDFTDAMILSFLAGMFYDFFYTNTFLLYTVMFTLLCFIVKAWTKHLGDSLIETVIICVSSIFAMQLITFLILKATNQTSISFYSWMSNRMVLTLLINGILVIVLYFLTKLRDDYLLRKDLRTRKEEKLFLFKAKR